MSNMTYRELQQTRTLDRRVANSTWYRASMIALAAGMSIGAALFLEYIVPTHNNYQAPQQASQSTQPDTNYKGSK